MFVGASKGGRDKEMNVIGHDFKLNNLPVFGFRYCFNLLLQKLLEDVEICESKLFRRDSDFYLHLTTQKEIGFVKVKTSGHVLYASPSFTVNEGTVVIAIDIGEATS